MNPVFFNYLCPKAAFAAIAALLFCFPAFAKADRYGQYVEQFSAMAQNEMAEFGIPASITLAQGLLESAAGYSTLATEGNNHFGIKCHNSWSGPTMLRSDDAPDECFRVYNDASQSFRDHSIFLTRKRYASLFLLDPLDYAAWARGLSQCGYATDPHYADRLIAIIEKYELFNFDTPASQRAEADAEFIRNMLGKTRRICKYRGLHYIVATPGDTYAALADEMKIDVARIIAYNDVSDPSQTITPWQEIYLQPKHSVGPSDVSSAVIGRDESIHSIAQRFAMTESSIRTLNPKAKDKPGTRLKLR